MFIDIHGVELGSNNAFRTESYDHMEPVGVDPRWDAFGPFHDYLFESFPLVCVFLHVRIEFLIVFNWFGQSFHPVAYQSQHLGYGLRVGWVGRKPQTGLICRTSRYGLRFVH